MRRRPVESPNEKTDRRERRKKLRNKKAAQTQSTRLCLGVAILVSIPMIWYVYSHYQESRSRDPFTGLKIKPFEQVRDKILNVGRANHNVVKKQMTTDEAPAAGQARHSLLTEEEDEALETDADGIRYHLIFSTDCTPYQHWQSYLVYYTAMSIKQPGHVTRIASGCEGEEADKMQQWFYKDVAPLSKRFHLQMTPKFSTVMSESVIRRDGVLIMQKASDNEW